MGTTALKIKETRIDEPSKEIVRCGSTTTFSDRFHVSSRSDDLVFMEGFCQTPKSLNENFTTMIPKETAVVLLEILAKAIDHYPVKVAEEPSPPGDKAVKKGQ